MHLRMMGVYCLGTLFLVDILCIRWCLLMPSSHLFKAIATEIGGSYGGDRIHRLFFSRRRNDRRWRWRWPAWLMTLLFHFLDQTVTVERMRPRRRRRSISVDTTAKDVEVRFTPFDYPDRVREWYWSPLPFVHTEQHDPRFVQCCYSFRSELGGNRERPRTDLIIGEDEVVGGSRRRGSSTTAEAHMNIVSMMGGCWLWQSVRRWWLGRAEVVVD